MSATLARGAPRLISWVEKPGERTSVLLYANQELIHEDRPAQFEDGSKQRMVYIRDANLPVRVVREIGSLYAGEPAMTEMVELEMDVRVE